MGHFCRVDDIRKCGYTPRTLREKVEIFSLRQEEPHNADGWPSIAAFLGSSTNTVDTSLSDTDMYSQTVHAAAGVGAATPRHRRQATSLSCSSNRTRRCPPPETSAADSRWFMLLSRSHSVGNDDMPTITSCPGKVIGGAATQRCVVTHGVRR